MDEQFNLGHSFDKYASVNVKIVEITQLDR